MAEKSGVGDQLHTLHLSDREALELCGVVDVDSYDEHTVTVRTVCGILCIEGEGLHVRHLALESGTLSIEGRISGMNYTEDQRTGAGGFFARLLK